MSADQCIFDTTLREAIAPWNLELTSEQADQLFAHFTAVIETNRTTNLTRITDPTEAAVKHYADSLALLPWLDGCGYDVQRVLDIGTGAGFPAIPLAILRPGWSIVAIDGTAKKIAFVRGVVEALGLTNVAPEPEHSRHYKPAQPFDLVLTRAVGSLTKCLTASGRHTTPNGLVVAYRTPAVACEVDDAASIERHSHLSRLEPYAYKLRLSGVPIERLLVPFRRNP